MYPIKQNLYHPIHQIFGCVSIARIKRMARKGLMEVLPTNLPDLEDTCPICLLTKATKIPRDTTIYVSKCSPRFMLHMNFAFFNV